MTVEQQNQHHTSEPNEFVHQAKGRSRSLLREYFDLLRYSKKWWLTPIIISLLLVGVFVLLSSTVVAPLIYTLF